MQKRFVHKMEDFVPVMLEFFAEGKNVTLPAVGNSMAPLIRNKKDSIVLAAYKGEKLVTGDIIFYKRKDGRYVLHRIVDITADSKFITLGDNQTNFIETVTANQIIAVPVSIIRGSKTIPVNSKAHKIYTKLWGKKSFFRWLHTIFFALRIKISKFIKKFM